jgi:hypothetical protein
MEIIPGVLEMLRAELSAGVPMPVVLSDPASAEGKLSISLVNIDVERAAGPQLLGLTVLLSANCAGAAYSDGVAAISAAMRVLDDKPVFAKPDIEGVERVTVTMINLDLATMCSLARFMPAACYHLRVPTGGIDGGAKEAHDRSRLEASWPAEYNRPR